MSGMVRYTKRKPIGVVQYITPEAIVRLEAAGHMAADGDGVLIYVTDSVADGDDECRSLTNQMSLLGELGEGVTFRVERAPW